MHSFFLAAPQPTRILTWAKCIVFESEETADSQKRINSLTRADHQAQIHRRKKKIENKKIKTLYSVVIGVFFSSFSSDELTLVF